MAETIQMNFNVQKETRTKVEEMARSTFRTPGKLLDWIVDRAYQEFIKEHNQPKKQSSN